MENGPDFGRDFGSMLSADAQLPPRCCFAHPTYFNLLSCSDSQDYAVLRASFHVDSGKSRKGERLETFVEGIRKVRNFIERKQEDEWRRALVCGIFFLSDSLSLNIQQLRILMGKCKSSINGSLQQLGYAAQSSSSETEQEFLARIPLNFRDATELKKWTIRKSVKTTPRIETQPQFVIPLPASWRPQVNVETEAVHVIVHRTFPCPVKCRYKYLDIIHRSVSIQTGSSALDLRSC
jgi:hypothetical protein